jgi:hypothetical protein
MADSKAAQDMVLEASAVLQRGLAGGGLDDRKVATALWGIVDNPAARRAIEQARARPVR